MQTKRAVYCGFVLILAAVLAVVPAAAADKSDIAGLAAVWEKEYNAGNLAAACGAVRQRWLPHAA